MKHLKYFKENYNQSDIDTIIDIFRDLSEDNNIYKYVPTTDWTQGCIYQYQVYNKNISPLFMNGSVDKEISVPHKDPLITFWIDIWKDVTDVQISKIEKDIHGFQKRVESIGYKCVIIDHSELCKSGSLKALNIGKECIKYHAPKYNKRFEIVVS